MSDSQSLTLSDVLAASYTFQEELPPVTLDNTVLLMIDVQHLATPEHLAKAAVGAGLDAQAVESALQDYSMRFYAAVENCARLLGAAREANLECIHIKIEALSSNARDTGPSHRRLGWTYPPGSPETQILDAVAPLPGEIVITKTVSGAFTATNLDAVLRHMGIDWLLIAGFETDECIKATGRAALDLGYLALFADDGCTAYDGDAHATFMGKYDSWGLARSTDDLIALLGQMSSAASG